MRVIIIGGGKVGCRLVELLQNENHDVVLIDIKQSVVDKMIETCDVMGIVGSGINCRTLEEAGVEKSDLTIAVTTQDELNVLSCVIASKMGTKRCVARVRKPEYYKQSAFMRNELNINAIVNPEFLAAAEISRLIRFPAAIKTEVFGRGRLEIAQIKINGGSLLDGLALSTLYRKYKVKVLICAVRRGNEAIIPKGDFIIREGDRIYVTAGHAEIMSFMRTFKIVNQRLKTVMLIGGGKIAYYLAQILIASGIRVKIIECDYERCCELSGFLPKADIICADGTSREILEEEGINNVDALVTLTGIDEENIIISMFARMKKVDKVITKVDKLEFANLIDSVGIDSIVTPKNITANVILGLARAMEASAGTEIRAVYQIMDKKAEVVELKITQSSKLTEKPLCSIKFKDNTLIAAIIRKNKLCFPDGDSIIEVGDTVVVFTTHIIKKMEDLLK